MTLDAESEGVRRILTRPQPTLIPPLSPQQQAFNLTLLRHDYQRGKVSEYGDPAGDWTRRGIRQSDETTAP